MRFMIWIHLIRDQCVTRPRTWLPSFFRIPWQHRRRLRLCYTRKTWNNCVEAGWIDVKWHGYKVNTQSLVWCDLKSHRSWSILTINKMPVPAKQSFIKFPYLRKQSWIWISPAATISLSTTAGRTSTDAMCIRTETRSLANSESWRTESKDAKFHRELVSIFSILFLGWMSYMSYVYMMSSIERRPLSPCSCRTFTRHRDSSHQDSSHAENLPSRVGSCLAVWSQRLLVIKLYKVRCSRSYRALRDVGWRRDVKCWTQIREKDP